MKEFPKENVLDLEALRMERKASLLIFRHLQNFRKDATVPLLEVAGKNLVECRNERAYFQKKIYEALDVYDTVAATEYAYEVATLLLGEYVLGNPNRRFDDLEFNAEDVEGVIDPYHKYMPIDMDKDNPRGLFREEKPREVKSPYSQKDYVEGLDLVTPFTMKRSLTDQNIVSDIFTDDMTTQERLFQEEERRKALRTAEKKVKTNVHPLKEIILADIPADEKSETKESEELLPPPEQNRQEIKDRPIRKRINPDSRFTIIPQQESEKVPGLVDIPTLPSEEAPKQKKEKRKRRKDTSSNSSQSSQSNYKQSDERGERVSDTIADMSQAPKPQDPSKAPSVQEKNQKAIEATLLAQKDSILEALKKNPSAGIEVLRSFGLDTPQKIAGFKANINNRFLAARTEGRIGDLEPLFLMGNLLSVAEGVLSKPYIKSEVAGEARRTPAYNLDVLSEGFNETDFGDDVEDAVVVAPTTSSNGGGSGPSSNSGTSNQNQRALPPHVDETQPREVALEPGLYGRDPQVFPIKRIDDTPPRQTTGAENLPPPPRQPTVIPIERRQSSGAENLPPPPPLPNRGLQNVERISGTPPPLPPRGENPRTEGQPARNLDIDRETYFQAMRQRNNVFRSLPTWLGGRKKMEWVDENGLTRTSNMGGKNGKKDLEGMRHQYLSNVEKQRTEGLHNHLGAISQDLIRRGITGPEANRILTEKAQEFLRNHQSLEDSRVNDFVTSDRLETGLHDKFQKWWKNPKNKWTRLAIGVGLGAAVLATGGLAAGGILGATLVGGKMLFSGMSTHMLAKQGLERGSLGLHRLGISQRGEIDKLPQFTSQYGKPDDSYWKRQPAGAYEARVAEERASYEQNMRQEVSSWDTARLRAEVGRLRMLSVEKGVTLENAGVNGEATSSVARMLIEEERRRTVEEAMATARNNQLEGNTPEARLSSFANILSTRVSRSKDALLEASEKTGDTERSDKWKRTAVAGTLGLLTAGTIGYLQYVKVPDAPVTPPSGGPLPKVFELPFDNAPAQAVITINEHGEGMTQATMQYLTENGVRPDVAQAWVTKAYYAGEQIQGKNEMFNLVHDTDQFRINLGISLDQLKTLTPDQIRGLSVDDIVNGRGDIARAIRGTFNSDRWVGGGGTPGLELPNGGWGTPGYGQVAQGVVENSQGVGQVGSTAARTAIENASPASAPSAYADVFTNASEKANAQFGFGETRFMNPDGTSSVTPQAATDMLKGTTGADGGFSSTAKRMAENAEAQLDSSKAKAAADAARATASTAGNVVINPDGSIGQITPPDTR